MALSPTLFPALRDENLFMTFCRSSFFLSVGASRQRRSLSHLQPCLPSHLKVANCWDVMPRWKQQAFYGSMSLLFFPLPIQLIRFSESEGFFFFFLKGIRRYHFISFLSRQVWLYTIYGVCNRETVLGSQPIPPVSLRFINFPSFNTLSCSGHTYQRANVPKRLGKPFTLWEKWNLLIHKTRFKKKKYSF